MSWFAGTRSCARRSAFWTASPARSSPSAPTSRCGWSTSANLADAERLADEEVRRPFDLEHGPLLRFTLLRHGDDWSVLLACVHHIVADGWSLGILTRDLSALYGAFASRLPPALPELPVQYADYTVWQRERLGGPAGEKQLAYWREALAGHEPLELAADRPATAAAVVSRRARRLRTRTATSAARGGAEPRGAARRRS